MNKTRVTVAALLLAVFSWLAYILLQRKGS